VVSPQIIAETLAEGDCVRFRVNGHCMFPLLAHDQEITVAKVSSYLPGDIIVFAGSNGEWLVHRYLGCIPFLTNPRFLTRADNSRAIDTIPVRSLALGKVIAVEDNRLPISFAMRIRCGAEFIGWIALLVVKKMRNRLDAQSGSP
jgi:hypothetical protein